MPRPLVRRALLLSIALALAGADAHAVDPADDQGDWELDLAIYGWVPDMKGDASLGGLSVEIDPQIWNDIIRNLDGALMGALEVRYRRRWLAQLDLVVSKLSDEIESASRQVGFGPATLQSGPVLLNIPRVETTVGPVEVDTTMLLVQTRLALGYRILEAPLREALGRDPGDVPRRLALDAFAGARLWYVDAEVDIDSPPVAIPGFSVEPSLVAFPGLDLGEVEIPGFTFGGRGLDAQESQWWVDPIVGLRALVQPGERLALSLAGNVGGFGVGSASKFAWEASTVAFYALGERVRLALGYRVQGLERERSDLELDLLLHGPIVGVVIGF